MLGFLGQLRKAIGSGIKTTGGMFAKGFKKLGELQDDEAGGLLPGPGGTGGFAGNAGLPQRGGLINRRNPIQDRLPTLQPPNTPPIEPLRESVNIMDRPPLGQVRVSTESLPTSVAERPIVSVRPPDFLRGRGATMEDTPIDHARYRYQTEYMNEGKIPRRWQDIAINALHGAAQGFQRTGDLAGALGGSITGSVGSAISPLHGRDFRFQVEQMPRLMASQAESERLEDRDYERQRRRADLEGLRARTQATIAGMKDAELEQKYRQAQIEKLEAEAQAKLTGRPQQFRKYIPETGEYVIGWKYPDGREVFSGQSADAQLKLEEIEAQNQRTDKQIKSREKIVGMQQHGATKRTGMVQAGQDRRQRERLAAGDGVSADSPIPYGPPVPNIDGSPRRRAIIQRAIDAGYTREQAIAEANKRGIW